MTDPTNQFPAQCRLRPEGLSEGLATGAVLVHGEFVSRSRRGTGVTEETDAEPDFARGRSCGEAQEKEWVQTRNVNHIYNMYICMYIYNHIYIRIYTYRRTSSARVLAFSFGTKLCWYFVWGICLYHHRRLPCQSGWNFLEKERISKWPEDEDPMDESWWFC